jgi:putative restriction endonuclease
VPDSWSPNIVTGKGFDAAAGDGRYLWQAVSERLALSVAEAEARYATPSLIAPRLGQGAFRLSVTDSYERRCAVTGEKTLPILDAAHIKAFSAGGEHTPSNGILLRTDIHRLFDLGYVTIDSAGKFEVGRRLKADFDNGRHYYDLRGAPVRKPNNDDASPSADAIKWHRERCFLG